MNQAPIRDFLFPVVIPPGFAPSDVDHDGPDIGGTNKLCPGQDAGDGFRPRWGGGFRAERIHDGRTVFHRALDIMAAEGAPIIAPDDCTVAMSWRPGSGASVPGVGVSPKGGNYLVLDTHDGWRFYMAHLLELPVLRPGDEVRMGDVVGRVGRTGNAVRKRRLRDGTTVLRGCPHLHIAVIATKSALRMEARGRGIDVIGDHVDPLPFFSASYGLGHWRSPG